MMVILCTQVDVANVTVEDVASPTMSTDSANSESYSATSHIHARSRSNVNMSKLAQRLNRQPSKAAFKKKVSIFDSKNAAAVAPVGAGGFLGGDEERSEFGAQDIMNALGIAVSFSMSLCHTALSCYDNLEPKNSDSSPFLVSHHPLPHLFDFSRHYADVSVI